MHDFTLPLAFWMPTGWEWLIVGAVGLLLFGKRLPEVGRSLGKGIVEFKRGLKGVTDEIESESDKPAALPKPAQEPEARPYQAEKVENA
ncbi:MAG: twin-arginine translocase TatA/TatE family subunit [Planctomycetota bacterium]